jgi:hypothetical protein
MDSGASPFSDRQQSMFQILFELDGSFRGGGPFTPRDGVAFAEHLPELPMVPNNVKPFN